MSARPVSRLPRVELRHVPGCPHAEAARKVLSACLDRLGLAGPGGVKVVELVGDYPSPTVLVDGVDVMGGPPAAGAACRLDPPTVQRILAALSTSSSARPGADE